MLKLNTLTIRDKLLRVALRLLGSKDDAEDVAQEVLLKLYQRDDVDQMRSVEAYAVTMTKNLCLDMKRHSSRYPKVEIDQVSLRHDEHTPLSRLEQADCRSVVHQSIDGLNESYKLVIHLRDIEEMEFEEIASIMGMNENQVRVTLSRARKKLRESLLNNKNFEDGTYRNAACKVL